MRLMGRYVLLVIAVISIAQWPALSQQRVERPPLFFRTDWKFSPVKPGAAITPAQSNLASSNPNLEFKIYGSARLIPNEPVIEGVAASDFPRVWTGNCGTACGITFRDKENYVDLTGRGMIRWATQVSGFHAVRPLVKLTDGMWLAGDHVDSFNSGADGEFHESEFSLSDVRWIEMDMERMVTAAGCGVQEPCKPRPGTGTWVPNVDLSKVDEIGFIDLTPGSGHGRGGSSGFGWMEVYGKPVKR